MDGPVDAVEIFVELVNGLRKKEFKLNSPLDEIVIKICKSNLAYIDNRKNAKVRYKYDFWSSIKKQFKGRKHFQEWMRDRGVSERILYSKSEQFPDFIFKAKRHENLFTCGSILELKDSKGGSIASFNSTLPTKYKSLEEIDIINGNNLVSKITSIIDGEHATDQNYYSFQRKNFYLIRTHGDQSEKVKISIVDGSFFETVPKEHLIYQMILKILRNHLKKKNIIIPSEILENVEKSLSFITDQTIIAASQIIENASVRPRLRIMAEVHPEGNPHSSHYPEITERSVNLIVQKTPSDEKVENLISEKVSNVKIFTIKHKRNGEHTVFQVRF